MTNEKIKNKIFYYINSMKKLKGNTNKLLNIYNLYNYLILKYDEIEYYDFRKSCYNKIFFLLRDINSIKINYFYKKKNYKQVIRV